MSINGTERRATSEELTALRGLLPLPDECLARRLGYEVDHLQAILEMRQGVAPREVWRVRDFLLAVAAAHDVQPPAFSVLAQSRRRQAQRWFGRWDVPDATF